MRSLLVATVLAAGAAGLPAAARAAEAGRRPGSTATPTPAARLDPVRRGTRRPGRSSRRTSRRSWARRRAPAAAAPPAQAAGAARDRGPVHRREPDGAASCSSPTSAHRQLRARLRPLRRRDALRRATARTAPPTRRSRSFQELELGLQSVVDPYARADVFLSFTPDGVGRRGGLPHTLSLPAGLQLRAGKLFSPFGRQNQQQPPRLGLRRRTPRARLVAAEKLSGPGIDLAWLAPLPWFVELHVAWQATAPTPGDPSAGPGVARLLQYFLARRGDHARRRRVAAVRSDATAVFTDLGGVARLPPLGAAHDPVLPHAPGRALRAPHPRRIPAAPTPAVRADLLGGRGPSTASASRYDGARRCRRRARGASTATAPSRPGFPSEFQRLRLAGLVRRAARPAATVSRPCSALEFAIGAHGAHPF